MNRQFVSINLLNLLKHAVYIPSQECCNPSCWYLINICFSAPSVERERTALSDTGGVTDLQKVCTITHFVPEATFRKKYVFRCNWSGNERDPFVTGWSAFPRTSRNSLLLKWRDFGGLGVACRSRLIFKSEINPQHAFLRREVKASFPCRRFAACNRFRQKLPEIILTDSSHLRR